jgi:hypothetical protein
MSEDSIRRRVAAGRLHRVHRGVFAVGHAALSAQGHCLAAVLAVGRGPHRSGDVLAYWGAAVSHRSAASHWGMLPTVEGPVDVAVAGYGGRMRRAGIRIHRSQTLDSRALTLRQGIPVTTPVRTVADLREAAAKQRPGSISRRELRKAIRQANVLGLPLDEGDGRERLRGDLEGAFLAHHRGREAFQDDRARDLELRRRGFEVLRLSNGRWPRKRIASPRSWRRRWADCGPANPGR